MKCKDFFKRWPSMADAHETIRRNSPADIKIRTVEDRSGLNQWSIAAADGKVSIIFLQQVGHSDDKTYSSCVLLDPAKALELINELYAAYRELCPR